MFPPKDKPGAESEGDSDDEDAPTCNITRLSSRLLQTEGEVSRGKERKSTDVNGTLSLLRNKEREETVRKRRELECEVGQARQVVGQVVGQVGQVGREVGRKRKTRGTKCKFYSEQLRCDGVME